MDTKYPADSLHIDRRFRGTFSIQIKTARQCVSLGNVGREKTCPGSPACQCDGWGDEGHQTWTFLYRCRLRYPCSWSERWEHKLLCREAGVV